MLYIKEVTVSCCRNGEWFNHFSRYIQGVGTPPSRDSMSDPQATTDQTELDRIRQEIAVSLQRDRRRVRLSEKPVVGFELSNSGLKSVTLVARCWRWLWICLPVRR